LNAGNTRRGKSSTAWNLPDGSFFDRVRNGYLALSANEPQRVIRVDGLRPVEAIHADILNIVAQKMGIQQQLV